jgi:hypothetical protein
MCVRALRIMVPKSAGNSPATNIRSKCRENSASQIFYVTRYGIFCVQQFSNADAAGWVRKFLAMVNWRMWQLLRHVRSTSKADTIRKDRHVRGGQKRA